VLVIGWYLHAIEAVEPVADHLHMVSRTPEERVRKAVVDRNHVKTGQSENVMTLAKLDVGSNEHARIAAATVSIVQAISGWLRRFYQWLASSGHAPRYLTWSSVVSAVLAAPPLLNQAQAGGTQRPVGTSFGVPGSSSKFDYVVSLFFSLLCGYLTKKIIGGGTAGLTVAERLSEDPTISVAVIEAGGFYELDNGNVSQIPAFYAKNFNQTAAPETIQPLIDWEYIIEPQVGLANRRFHYSQGKTLGGSSGRNSNIFTRGTKGYYQRWADLVGDPSWAWDNILPYFKKSVDFTPPDTAKMGVDANISYDPAAYGAGGPLHVAYSNYYQPMNPGLIKGFEALNFSYQPGFSSGRMDGYGYLAVTIDPKTQIKDSSETAFLSGAFNATNFRVYKNTIAQKILFQGTTATGVQVETAGLSYTLEAAKEVIVAAGVTRSPQMLMVSGVGPRDILAQHNIPVIVDRQVGQNWQDHCAFEFQYKMNVEGNAALEGDKQFLYQATEDFLQTQTGPLTNWGGDILGFEKLPSPYREALNQSALTELAELPNDQPEIEWLIASHGPQMATSSYVTFTPAILAVTSKGTIGLSSPNAADNPIIDPKTFSSPTEQALGIQIYKRLQEFVNATGLTTGPELKIGPRDSDADILAGMKQTGLPWYHGVASCPMGKESDPNAVVDGNGRVFGTKGLRVVDASVIPLIAPGHSMAPVYMVAEKLADAIKKGL
ncbi:MAG: hypothetical protein L6R36_008758, partial [Xanthoria steineri]